MPPIIATSLSLFSKMATAAPLATHVQASKMKFIKQIAESPDLRSIPSTYAYTTNPNEAAAGSDPDDSIPIIDFALLTSGDPHQRSKSIKDLTKACLDWGFFMVINHGVPERLMKGVIDTCSEFFNLTVEEKQEFEGKHALDPIRCGTSFNAKVDKVFFWRDFLKVFVHPEFHFPHIPQGFSELSFEYCKRVQKVVRELLNGISESLGLEESYIEKTMNLDSGSQLFIANLYPPCPQPELAMGMPPHTDHGLLTLLMQNQIGGLQLMHKGNWVNVNALPNSFLVNTGDHLEILSNGKYKSVLHRAVVNNKATRISVAIANGPSLDTVVGPATELVNSKNHPPAYIPMKYKEYVELRLSIQLEGKSYSDHVRPQIV